MIDGISGFSNIAKVGTGNGSANPLPNPGGEDGKSFADALKDMIIDRPSASKAEADSLATKMAAGADIDPHQLAIATAKAGVEIQMATRTISSAVSGVKQILQTQI
jgi:flagellar hook-basal body complex protein FliE